MLGLAEPDFERPSSCPPWTVAELFAHVHTATARVVTMLAEPGPGAGTGTGTQARAEEVIGAVGYYRPGLFAPETDAERIASARDHAADLGSGHDLAVRFHSAWRRTYAAARAERPDLRVTTRHGDLMLLTDFMVTRVAELVLHGLDLAISLEREPWTTEQAAAVVERLLLTAEGSAARPRLDWDRPTFLAKATGRTPMTGEETEAVERLGITWIALS